MSADSKMPDARLTRAAETVVSGFFSGGNRDMVPARRSRGTTEPARRVPGSRAPKRVKHTRVAPLGPTPERLAKGDLVDDPKVGTHRSMPPIERLFTDKKLDHNPGAARAMYEAALKLQRHFVQANLVGVKAQDLNRVIGGGGDALQGDEHWVHHFDVFRRACKMMGWFEGSPHRGAARIVVSVVCHEQAVRQAGLAHLPPSRDALMQALAMDRLREGLFALAMHWRT